MCLIMLKKCTLFLILTLPFLFILNQSGNFVYAEEYEQIEIEGLKYPMYESADIISQVNNTESIEIALPATSWNVTKFELNFTDIRLGKEIKEFEVIDTGFKVIEKFGNNYGYAVQINISEPTTVYGTYIYGFKNDWADKILRVQINGYNPVKNAPDDTLYGTPISLNITKYVGWYYQEFVNPINLPIGKYFLVVNGSNIFTAQDKYYWGYNSYTQFPNLHVSTYDGYTWSEGVKNSTLLYKLVQSIDRIYNPQEINMTLKIDNTYYNILNGNTNGTGYVKISKLNYSPDMNPLIIPIKSNSSAKLNFSYNHILGIKNKFDADGSVILELDKVVQWKIKPMIIRIESNYSVKLYYPVNWNDIKIYRNGLLINSELNVIINTDEKYISLNSEIVLIGASWLITALSSQEILDINFPKKEFEPKQELKFSIELPQVEGNVSWKLIDVLGFEEFSETRKVISETMSFSYQIPEKPYEGNCKVIIIWYNNQKAGIDSQDIKINIPFTLDPYSIILIVIIIGIISTVSTASYMTIKKVRNKIQRNKKKLIDKFMDVLNLNYFMVIDKDSGLCVYEEILVGKIVDSTLISGFLDAIRSFGIELTGSYQQSKTIKLEYKDSKILMVEFKNFRLIFIMKENPSNDFLKSITDLSYEIDEKYGYLLSNFNNDVMPFKGIKLLVKKHLNTTFLEPLKVVENKNIKLNSTEKNEINNALDFMKENLLEYFYTSFLLPQQDCEPSKIKAIFNLIEKEIFQPTILKEQKLHK